MSDTGLGPSVQVDPSGKTEITSKNTSAKASGNDMDRDAFLKLLVTQLQYQDPLNPMDNTAFVAQTAQFSALEQMQNLNSTMTKSQAFAMIGREVDTLAYNEKTSTYEQISGIVEYVTMKSNEPYIVIGDKEIKYSEVKNVFEGADNVSQNLAVSQAMSLIGKTVQAITLDSENKPKEFIEGKVEHVKFIGGTPVLSIGGKDVKPYEVLSVSENGLLKGKPIKAAIYNEDTAEYDIISGTIDKIKIDNDKDKVYIVVDGKDVEIKNIATVTDAFSYLGKEINTSEVSGIVDSIIIRNTKAYLMVGDKEVDFEKMMTK